MTSPYPSGPESQSDLPSADAIPAEATPAEATPAEAIPADGDLPEPERVYKGTGVVWALVATLVAIVCLIILIAQNTGPVTVNFLWFTPVVSLVVLVLTAVVLAVCVTEGIGLVWRHRRRQRLTQRDELRRIHSAEN